MQVITTPDKKEWKRLLRRPYADNTSVLKTVQDVLSEVKARGDIAVKELTRKILPALF